MASPPPTDDAPRTFSGTWFVVLVLLGVALFVTFLLVGSPVLLERTLEQVPPAAPHTVQQGDGWEAVATQADEDTACLEVRAADALTEDCVGVRGLPLRLLDARPLEEGGAVLAYGIVDARTTRVALELAEGGPIVLEVVHVDFGFPLGFYATELRAGTTVERVVARDGDGEPRADAACAGESPTSAACAIRDLR